MSEHDSVKGRTFNLLRKMERYTKVDMAYVASGGFWSAFATIVSGGIALLTATAFANLLPKETYGTYQYVITMVSFLGLLGLPGTKTSISYAAARGFDGSFLDSVRTKIRWSFLAALAAFAIALYYLVRGNDLLASAFAITALFMPWWESFGSYVPYLQGKKRFKAFILYEAIVQIANAAALIAVMVFSDNLAILCLAFFGSYTLARFVFFKRALALEPPNAERDGSVLSYGKHLSVMNILGTLASNLDKFLLWQFLGPVAIAVYTFALAIPLRAVGGLASINRLYFPKAAERSLPEIRAVIFGRLGLLLLASTGIALLYALAAPFIFDIFFRQYQEAVIYTQLAAIIIALQPFSLLATALSAHAKKRELYIITSVPPVLQIVLLLILVPLFGLLGAMATLLAMQVVESLITVFLFIRASRNQLVPEQVATSLDDRSN